MIVWKKAILLGAAIREAPEAEVETLLSQPYSSDS